MEIDKKYTDSFILNLEILSHLSMLNVDTSFVSEP